MNKDFEKLPEIAERVKNLEFNNHTKQYESSLMCCSDEAFANGALYAYQEQQRKYAELEAMYIQQGLNMLEQQKKIDDVLNLVCKLQYSSGERIYSEIKELLK